MSDITEFLLARISEDEEAARAEREHPGMNEYDDGDYNSPPRVLAECEAKRRIIADRPWPIGRVWDFQRAQHDSTLRLLALPYADHPDYQQEWKP